MNKSKKLTFKLFRGQNVSASRVENERAGGAKNEKSISEAARLLDRWEYLYYHNILEILANADLSLSKKLCKSYQGGRFGLLK